MPGDSGALAERGSDRWVLALAGGAVVAVVLIAAILAVSVLQPSSGRSLTRANTQSSAAAYQAYRQGERAGLSAGDTGASAYQSYRQGERIDLSGANAAAAYQSYRQGERSDVSGSSCTTALTARERRDRSDNLIGGSTLVTTTTCK